MMLWGFWPGCSVIGVSWCRTDWRNGVGWERDEYDWESGQMSIMPDVFDDGPRLLNLQEVYKLDDFMALHFPDEHSSAEVLYLKFQTPRSICTGY